MFAISFESPLAWMYHEHSSLVNPHVTDWGPAAPPLWVADLSGILCRELPPLCYIQRQPGGAFLPREWPGLCVAEGQALCKSVTSLCVSVSFPICRVMAH